MLIEIQILLYPSALAIDISSTLEVFHLANELLKLRGEWQSGYQARVVSFNLDPTPMSTGHSMNPDALFSKDNACDTFVIPGGINTSTVTFNPLFMKELTLYLKSTRRVIALCKGTFILAETGILEGKEATTHWSQLKSFSHQFPNVKAMDQKLFTSHGPILTGAGASASIDLALNCVREDFGFSIAQEAAKYLAVQDIRIGDCTQFSDNLVMKTSTNNQIEDLLKWIERHLKERLPIVRLAQHMMMSPRHLLRSFQKHTKMTPADYIEGKRVNRALDLLKNSSESFESIADCCGFGSTERMRRAIMRRHGVTPSMLKQIKKW